MRLLLVEGNMDQHSSPLAYCLRDLLGNDTFAYVGLEPMPSSRAAMGWQFKADEPWMISAWRSREGAERYRRWWDEADVVLTSQRTYPEIESRLRADKPVFYMSERWWKPPFGMARLLHPGYARRALYYRRLAQSPLLHYLPIGPYAAADMARFVTMQGRMWMWAYFIDAADKADVSRRDEEGPVVLWAGRFLRWKRVDCLVSAFAAAVREVPAARLRLIGDGPDRQHIESLIDTLNVRSHVEVRPSIPPSQVREQMRKAQIYVLPSNGYEGWGAVVNEAMSEGCTVLGSIHAGAAKTMIEHGRDGLLFDPGRPEQLAEMLKQVLADAQLRKRLSEAGRKTATTLWSPQCAAQRFLAVADAVMAGRSAPVYENGPMRPA